jgi:CDP-glucose 4,6-dehydratase
VKFWKNKKVFVTGHTGFKGGWLSLTLQNFGAEVTGYALNPPTNPSFFEALKLDQKIKSVIGDVRDVGAMSKAFEKSQAEIVFHLAAQPLVRASYENPLETYSTNVMGTVNLLDSVRLSRTPPRAVVVITTDKVYKNQEKSNGYQENDSLGGFDPYSNSKACAELAVDSYRNSFLKPRQIPVVTARAGNVIGGGDWAADRLIPDFVRASTENKSLRLRNPKSVRPWQHVVEPIFAYLKLAEALATEKAPSTEYNFGPAETDVHTTQEIIDESCRIWGRGARWELHEGAHPHETKMLTLNTDRARKELGFEGTLEWKRALEWTLKWYQTYYYQKDQLEGLTLEQIKSYGTGAKS